MLDEAIPAETRRITIGSHVGRHAPLAMVRVRVWPGVSSPLRIVGQ
jgi:hypothetical protein